MENWILRGIRGAATRRVIAWACALAAVAWIGSLQRDYFYNCLRGPFDLTPAQLAAIGGNPEASDRDFARIRGSEVLATGIEEITIRKKRGVETGRSVTGLFYVLRLGDRLLLFKGAPDGTQVSPDMQGPLVPIPRDIESQLFSSDTLREVRSQFYPFVLDRTQDYRGTAYLEMALFAVLLILLTWFGRRDWKHMRDPQSHPLLRRVSGWGSVVMIANDAQRDVERPQHKAKSWRLGQRYIARTGLFHFDLYRFDDLLWLYKRVTRQRTNLIFVSKDYGAVLHFDDGKIDIRAREKIVDVLLEYVASKVPWALVGHDEEFERAYSKSLPTLKGYVDGRRQEWRRQHATAAAAPR